MSEHRRVCEVVARWCLGQSWCGLAAVECGVPFGFADVLACSDPQRVPVCPEHAIRSAREQKEQRARQLQLFRSGDHRAAARSGLRWRVPPVLPARKYEPAPRVVIVECKRTRADLLGDLRARKLLKYQDTATHLYLAATPTALGGRDRSSALMDLQSRGLPAAWGVLEVRGQDVVSLRPSRAVRPATAGDVWVTALTIGRSLSHRSVR